jgi:hypothetical protein
VGFKSEVNGFLVNITPFPLAMYIIVHASNHLEIIKDDFDEKDKCWYNKVYLHVRIGYRHYYSRALPRTSKDIDYYVKKCIAEFTEEFPSFRFCTKKNPDFCWG